MPGPGSQACPKPTKLDRVLAKKRERRDEDKAWDACCKVVDARDGKRCRCCGRKAKPDASTLLERMHRHHLRYRSKGVDHDPANVVSLCAWCHGAEHAGQLEVLGDDANGMLTFEVDEAAVVAIFGTKPLPKHCHIVLPSGDRKVS